MAMLDYFVEQEEITNLILAPSLPSRAFVCVFSVTRGYISSRGKWNIVVLELNEARAIWKRGFFFEHAKHWPCLRLDRVCFVSSTHEFCRNRGDLCVAQCSLHQNVFSLDNFSNYCPQLHAATHHSRQHPTTALKHLYQFLNLFDCKFAFEKLRGMGQNPSICLIKEKRTARHPQCRPGQINRRCKVSTSNY